MPSENPTGSPETELKFRLPVGGLPTLAQDPNLGDAGPRSRLRSIYFDTPEHDLRNSGFSLRVREKNGAFVQTLKRRNGKGVFDREEWETAVQGAQPDSAVLVATPAGKVLNGSADRLAPVFETCIERTIRLWNDGTNIVEVSLDEGEVIAAEQRTPVHELELELRSGDPAALFQLAGQLAGQTPMTLSFQSKAERGYRLAGHEGAAAIRAERGAITGDTPLAAAFRQIARDCLGQIAGNAELLRSAPAPRLLHQTRVGLRRLRAALATFKPMLDPDGLERARAELKWLAGELNAARDVDVFAETFLRQTDDGVIEDPSLAALNQRLLEAQARCHEQAAAALQSPRFSALLLEVSAWVEVGAWATIEEAHAAGLRATAAGAYAAARLDHLRRRVVKLGREFRHLDAPARHRLRLALKKLRYGAEFFAGAFSGPPVRRRRFTEAAKVLQDRLGELNDLALARRTAVRIVGPRASDLAFTAGQLVGARQQQEASMLTAAEAAYGALAAARPFWRKAARRTR
jgi:inorganic triphosphatase YgiF